MSKTFVALTGICAAFAVCAPAPAHAWLLTYVVKDKGYKRPGPLTPSIDRHVSA